MNKFILIAISLIWATFSLSGQGRFDDVQIQEYKLTDNIYMLEGAGGNVGIYIGEEEVLMIDDQYAPLSEKLMAKIKELSGGMTTKLINTHWHGDHSGGNENFGKSGAMIFAHENVRERMSKEVVRGDQVSPASPDIALPVVTYRDAMQLYFMGEPVMISHIHNAHTDGDSFVFFPESNVIHMGDCFFHKRFPYIDVSSGGSINGMIDGVEAAVMLVNDDTQIIPGHGPMATKADLIKYHTFLTTLRERVISHINAGGDDKSIDAAKMVEGYEDWSWGFIDAEKMVSIAYTSLTSKD